MKDKQLIDLGWLVGIFDGEGCITLNRNRVNTRHFVSFVAISNNQREILCHCTRIITTHKLPAPSLRGYQSWYKGGLGLFWNGYSGTVFLKYILPYLHNVKHVRRAKIYCEFFDPTKNGRKYKELIWIKWQQLVREEWVRGEHRGPRPWWLTKRN